MQPNEKKNIGENTNEKVRLVKNNHFGAYEWINTKIIYLQNLMHGMEFVLICLAHICTFNPNLSLYSTFYGNICSVLWFFKSFEYCTKNVFYIAIFILLKPVSI